MTNQLFPAALLALALPAAAQSIDVGRTPSTRSTATPSAQAAPAAMSPDAVLADDGKVRITRADYDLELTKLPPDLRVGFATTDKRVADLLTRLLVTRTLAADADLGVAREPYNAARLASELERAKAQLRVGQFDKEAGERFERDRAAWEKRARELWTTQPARYTAPEQITASHILFATDKRSLDEATSLAREARASIVAGRPFAQAASALSDDSGTKAMEGKLPPFIRGQMVPDFETAAFALKKGELSEPVVTPFGVHLILVQERVPEHRMSWDEARPQIMTELREQYVTTEREQALGVMADQARTYINMDLVKVMVISQPQELELNRMQRESMRRLPSRPAAK